MNEFAAGKPEICLPSIRYIERQSLIELTLIARSQDEIRKTEKSSELRVLRILSGTERYSELVR